MGDRGPAPKPNLQVVREGNPGHHSAERLERGVRVESQAPAEPDWREWWPPVRVPTQRQLERRHSELVVSGQLAHIDDPVKRAALVRARREWLIERDREQATRAKRVGQRAREVARRTWRRVVPILEHQGLLTLLDTDVLVDLCITKARLDECERNISELGVWQRGERGAMKNPATTVAHQLRSQFRFYVGQLGLSPVARDALNSSSGDGDEDDWD